MTRLTTILLLIACDLSLCASTPKIEAMAHGKAMAIISAQKVKTITLRWDANYLDTNTETVIESSFDLINWLEKFHGKTNAAIIAATNPAEFFKAHNRYIL